MKLTLHQINEGEDEVIINYRQMNDEVHGLMEYIENHEKRLCGFQGKIQYMIHPENILYFESVDDVTYIYTSKDVYRSTYTLSQVELFLSGYEYFRCSKSMIINICKISCLKSEPGCRINATMENGEHVMISRRYSKELREILKGGKG
jgi:DNA-binding LytR/AlgR family response regulator